MNLKMKMTQRLTAIARRIDDNIALFSDECTPSTDDCLRLITANDNEDVMKLCQDLAAELNKDTRWPTVLLWIERDNTTTRFVREKKVAESSF